MKPLYTAKPVIAGAPLIGEGNIIDNKAILKILAGAGIPGHGFYPNGLFVRFGARFHCNMSMSIKKTMDYALNSDKHRSALMVQPLKWELRKAIKRAIALYPDSLCFISSQNMMAEESIDICGDIPTCMASSDVFGKYNTDSVLSDRHRDITYLVWNREALDVYKNDLKLENVQLIKPFDPILAFEPIETSALPFQFALDEPHVCFIKLSGSGGDPGLVNEAVNSLWEKNRIKSIVFPGTEKAKREIIETGRSHVQVQTSLDASHYYHHAREIISNEHMMLTYPSEQVKHIAILTQNNIFPKVVWLPPRGVHEVENLAWAIKKGYSGSICIPSGYHGVLERRLIHSGINPSAIECIEPENVSADHFKVSPLFESEKEAPALDTAIKKILSV